MYRAATIVLLASALCACQRSAAGSAKASPTSISPSPASSIAPPAASTPATAAPATAASTAAVGSARATAGPSSQPAPADVGLLGLLGQGAQDGNLPEDFEIGPLAADRLLADEARAERVAAAAVLDAWTAGRVDRADFASDARETLAGMIGFALERGNVPLAWRLGPPRPTAGETVANIRLLAAGGSAEGEIYITREGGGVLVSDIQVDPARMNVARERPQRTFFPSPYRWLLGG
jgi:hypothetical protein